MKSQSNEEPLRIHDLGNGTSHFNHNVVHSINEDGQDVYDYDQVTVTNPVEYRKIVVALIRDRYSVDDEFSILRERDIDTAKFQVYFDFVEQCKATANE